METSTFRGTVWVTPPFAVLPECVVDSRHELLRIVLWSGGVTTSTRCVIDPTLATPVEIFDHLRHVCCHPPGLLDWLPFHWPFFGNQSERAPVEIDMLECIEV